MKKVLVLTYRYPPFGGIGAVRMTCVTKYLREYGWRPFVYTSDWNSENCQQFDADFGKDLNPYVIHRARIIPATQAPKNQSRGKLPQKLQRYWAGICELKNLHNWVVEGRKVLPRLIEIHKFDAMLATYPTTSALKLGAWVSREFGIPWVADFRDIIEERRSRIFWLKKELERKLVKSSSALMTVSEPLAEKLTARNHQPVYSVPNGFDPDAINFGSLKVDEPQEFFEIVYTGRLYPPGDPAREGPNLIFRALDLLADQGQLDLKQVKITIAGTPISQLQQHMTGLQSESQVNSIQWMTRKEVYRLQANATMLLSLGSRTMKGILTGKLFEYLQTRRPILSVPHDQDGIGAVLKKTNSGSTAETVEEVADFIINIYRNWVETRTLENCPPSDQLDEYNWEFGTKHVAEILNQISNDRQVPKCT